jgi:chemotaxis response regulator CheB
MRMVIAYRVKDHQLSNTSASFTALAQTQLQNLIQCSPAPRTRAEVDSFLNSFAEACGASALPTFFTGAGIDGDIFDVRAL